MSDYFDRIEAHLLDAVERGAARRARPLDAVRVRLGAMRGWLGARPGLLALLGVLALGGSAAGARLLVEQHSRPLTGVVPAYTAPRQNISLAGSRYSITISPSLQAGTIGWCNFTVFRDVPGLRGGRGGLGGGSCGTGTAAVGSPLFAPDGERGGALWYVLAAPQVAAVRFAGGPTVLTRADTRLPFGFRAAVTSLPRKLFSHGPPVVTALAADGRAIPGGAYEPPPPQQPTADWAGPQRSARGACSLSVRPSSGMRMTRGSVVTSIVPDRGIVGRAFLSCEEVELRLGRGSLLAAVLLDAGHPGSPPAALPDMRAVPGVPGVFVRSNTLPVGQFPYLLARRSGAAWLVVAGAETVRQGLRALGALSVGRLDPRPPRSAPRAAADAECAIALRPFAGLQEVSQSDYLIHGHRGPPLPRGGPAEVTTCTQAELYYRRRPLTAMVMYPIGGPGVPPSLRDRRPVPGHPGLFTIAAEVGARRDTVRRIGRVWLELDGGGGPAWQEAVIARIQVSVASARAPVTRDFASDPVTMLHLLDGGPL
ncbi:MAG TPA: hypothetical protein VMS02_09815 [Solirubrobacteraceae bacterium]|nr:hypothetical protein [Solirubrobacteraceae bacterium]